MAKTVHIHLHDFAGAGFRTQKGLRNVTRDVRSISYKQIQEMFRNGQWEAMSDLRKMGDTWGTQWVKRRVSGEWQPSEAVRVEQIPKDMNYKDCGCAKCAAARDMQQAYHGYLIKTGLRPDEYYISKDGQHIGTASTLQAAKQIIDQITDD